MKNSVMNIVLKSVAVVTLLAGLSQKLEAGYVYVGSWDLGNLEGNYDNPDNPYIWTKNPRVFSAVEAAAHLFGGNASDYAISTLGTDPANINHLAYVDGWADTQYLDNPTSETFSLDLGAPGYNDPSGFGSAYSALVTDHGPFYGVGVLVNYAFRLEQTAVPEPGSLLLFGAGAIGCCVISYRRRRSNAV